MAVSQSENCLFLKGCEVYFNLLENGGHFLHILFIRGCWSREDCSRQILFMLELKEYYIKSTEYDLGCLFKWVAWYRLIVWVLWNWLKLWQRLSYLTINRLLTAHPSTGITMLQNLRVGSINMLAACEAVYRFSPDPNISTTVAIIFHTDFCGILRMCCGILSCADGFLTSLSTAFRFILQL